MGRLDAEALGEGEGSAVVSEEREVNGCRRLLVEVSHRGEEEEGSAAVVLTGEGGNGALQLRC